MSTAPTETQDTIAGAAGDSPSRADHPLRALLASEVHARPFLRIDSPARVSHLAIYGEAGRDAHRDLLLRLFGELGTEPPHPAETHCTYRRGPQQIKWERHTEFSTFTFVLVGSGAEPFAETAVAQIAPQWLASLEGNRLVALNTEVLNGEAAAAARAAAPRLFAGPTLVGSRVLTGGEVWCDWYVRPDGFSRCQGRVRSEFMGATIFSRVAAQGAAALPG